MGGAARGKGERADTLQTKRKRTVLEAIAFNLGLGGIAPAGALRQSTQRQRQQHS